MKNVYGFIRLLRPLNLLMIALAGLAFRYLIIHPMIRTQPIPMKDEVSRLDYFLFISMFVLLAAAGNIINDYFDLRVDRINKPQRIVIDKYVKRRIAMVAHIIINSLAILIGLYISWRFQSIPLLVIPFFIAGSLWYYSLDFKKQFLTGNFAVALLAGLYPLCIALMEIPPLTGNYLEAMDRFYVDNQIEGKSSDFFVLIWIWMLFYAGFAFILNLVREIQKDMEDREGDKAAGYKTLAIQWKENNTKTLIAALLIIAMAVLVWLEYYLFQDMPISESWIYLAIYNLLIIVPLFMSMNKSVMAKTKSDYKAASNYTKIAIAGGIAYTLVFAHLINPEMFI